MLRKEKKTFPRETSAENIVILKEKVYNGK